MKTKTIQFKVEKETKATIRFAEICNGQPPVVGTLYVQKWFLGPMNPADIIQVKLEVKEGGAEQFSQ